MPIIGTCSVCTGPVATPDHWTETEPPIPQCLHCESRALRPYGPIIQMCASPPDFPDFPESVDTLFPSVTSERRSVLLKILNSPWLPE